MANRDPQTDAQMVDIVVPMLLLAGKMAYPVSLTLVYMHLTQRDLCYPLL